MTPKKPKVVVMNFTGMQYQYISAEHTPFLWKLAERNGIAELEGSRLFPDGSWYFGAEAHQHTIMFRLEYSPKTSPFRYFKFLAPVFSRVEALFPMGANKFFRAGISELISILAGNEYANYIKMPFEVAHNFDGSFYRVIRTRENLFSVLDANNISFNPFISRPIIKFFKRLRKRYNRLMDQHKMFLSDLVQNKTDLFIESLCRIDNICHEFGPFSPEAYTYVKKIDDFCRQVDDYLRQRFQNYFLLIVSDHGLTPVTRRFNIYDALDECGLVESRDYIIFVDSLAVRFWFLKPDIKEKLRRCLNRLDYGKILVNEDYNAFNLPFNEESRRKYGEIIFVVKNHVLLIPNYWQGTSDNKGMHGYLDREDRNLNGFLTVSGGHSDLRVIKTFAHKADITPTILSFFGLQAPQAMTGQPIVTWRD